MECLTDQCKQRRSDLENEVKMLRRELKAREENLRQLELETQVYQHTCSVIDVLYTAPKRIRQKRSRAYCHFLSSMALGA